MEVAEIRRFSEIAESLNKSLLNKDQFYSYYITSEKIEVYSNYPNLHVASYDPKEKRFSIRYDIGCLEIVEQQVKLRQLLRDNGISFIESPRGESLSKDLRERSSKLAKIAEQIK